MVAQSV